MEAESERSTDNHSTGDVVPEKLLAPKVSTYRLPRFSCRRLSSNSSFGDHDVLPRTMSMFPEPRELTKDDLTSADALMADDVFTMNATLSSVIENALGQPIPGLEGAFVVGGNVPYLSAEFADRFRESKIFQKTLKRLDSPVKEPLIIPDVKPFRLSFFEDLVM
ncbi:hypothetical protein PC129_g22842 [Phytophthora cactorum]|uniref:Uncharacterized protein n=1 Tax=Phytophthora cactorum TaxID=29920 RepID=A0A8T0YE02_9STRA|nr:hypothetical protein PC113_g23159 [Phytophthora cactorum]KAG3203543.1 hypothetical protein PC129_g22842 [Phytophthora cactorum]KAG4223943.1 hypothetical protein PC116_g27596 [Phytophthora cactorum]